MGCWNGSCALTGLPVFEDDPVHVFLLVQQPESMGLDGCEPNTYWSPLPYHFTGYYDGYGRVDRCEGAMLPSIIAKLKRHLHEYQVGENQYHDIAVTKEAFDIDLLFEADHERRLAIVGSWKTPNPMRVTHVIVHSGVINQLLSTFEIDTRPHKKVKFDKYVENGNALIDKLCNLSTDDLHFVTYTSRDDADFRLIHSFKDVIKYPDLFQDCDIGEAVSKGNIDEAHEIVRQRALAIVVNTYMDQARRQWTPMSGGGSQDSETTAQCLMAEITLNMAKTLNERWAGFD